MQTVNVTLHQSRALFRGNELEVDTQSWGTLKFFTPGQMKELQYHTPVCTHTPRQSPAPVYRKSTKNGRRPWRYILPECA